MLRRLIDKLFGVAQPVDTPAMQALRAEAERGLVMLREQLAQHERWQRNYEAGRYWGDDGDGDTSTPHLPS